MLSLCSWGADGQLAYITQVRARKLDFGYQQQSVSQRIVAYSGQTTAPRTLLGWCNMDHMKKTIYIQLLLCPPEFGREPLPGAELAAAAAKWGGDQSGDLGYAAAPAGDQ